MVFSDAKCSCLLAGGSRHDVHRWRRQKISETSWFPHIWRAAHIMPFLLLCVLAEPATCREKIVTILAPSTFHKSQAYGRTKKQSYRRRWLACGQPLGADPPWRSGQLWAVCR